MVTHVRSIAALEALRVALLRFKDASQTTLQEVEYELKRTFGWLQERRSYWKREMAIRSQQLERAESALRQCLAARDHQGRGPDCSELYALVARARHQLNEALTELQTAETHLKRVEHAAEQYSHQARKLINSLQTELPKGTDLLRHSVTMLSQYTTGGGVGSVPTAAGTGAVSAPPASGASQVLPGISAPAFPGEYRVAVDAVGTFIADKVLDRHAGKHSGAVGATSVADYLQRGQHFMSGSPDTDTLQLQRPNGDIVRWNMRTNHFGIVDSDGTLVTYYTLDKKKDPAKYFFSQYEYQR